MLQKAYSIQDPLDESCCIIFDVISDGQIFILDIGDVLIKRHKVYNNHELPVYWIDINSNYHYLRVVYNDHIYYKTK